MDIQPSWAAAIAASEVFREIPEAAVRRMLDCLGSDIRRYRKADAIVRAGDHFGGMGIIIEGGVAVQKLKPSGDLITMGVFGPSQVFGENIVFSDRREWLASVTAVEPSTILFLAADKIVGVCAQHCDGHRRLLANLLRALSNRALMLNRKIDYLSCKSLRGRVAMFILEHYERARRAQRDGAGPIMIELPSGRVAMAEFLNIPRPSLSRELALMKQDGLIDYHLNTVRITDLAGLRAAVEE
jgi:CRP-like cAMP-binding protein